MSVDVEKLVEEVEIVGGSIEGLCHPLALHHIGELLVGHLVEPLHKFLVHKGIQHIAGTEMHLDGHIGDDGEVDMYLGRILGMVVFLNKGEHFLLAALYPDVDVAHTAHQRVGIVHGVALSFEDTVAETQLLEFHRHFGCVHECFLVELLQFLLFKDPFHDVFVSGLVGAEIVFREFPVFHQQSGHIHAYDALLPSESQQVMPFDLGDALRHGSAVVQAETEKFQVKSCIVVHVIQFQRLVTH